MNAHPQALAALRQLQTELRDLAFLLDRQGSHAAAEFAISLAARVDDLPDESFAMPTRENEFR